MTLQIPFDNSYATLPTPLFTRQKAAPVAAPRLIAFNRALAETLGIGGAATDQDLAAVFSGNQIPEGATPLAQAYAGHQFGNWNPGLGDGRALLLGEVVGRDGQRRDIQLKGSGPTPYSRRGDGRNWVGPVLREYLISEAMHALGVPTTRALAAVTTGEAILREQGPLPGAILTRVAASHIRVGTFQLFAARGDGASLRALMDHTIARHYPSAKGPTDLLRAMMIAQAHLIAKWVSLGFIHGVMNTDNMAVSGETIDYGPCAFMDEYHPRRVFSSIDTGGRYAYNNQPQIALWNIAQFATALVALMPDQDAAIEEFTAVINAFADHYDAAYGAAMAAKIGLAASDRAAGLIDRLLTLMAQDEADFTNVFAGLGQDAARDQFLDRDGFDAWERDWQGMSPDPALMSGMNPRIIPRTHLIESVIQSGIAGDFGPFHSMLAVVTDPFRTLDETRAPYARPPAENERVRQTFCGT